MAAPAPPGSKHHVDPLRPEQLAPITKEFGDRGLLSMPLEGDPHRAAFWESVRCKAKPAEVALADIATNCGDLVSYALRANGLTQSATGSFLIVATDDYLRPEIMQFASRSAPWLLAKPVGHTVWIGPLFQPGKTACYSCMASAMRTNRWLQSAFSAAARLPYPAQPSVAALPSTVAVAAGMISTAAAVFLATGSHEALESSVLTLDTRTMRMGVNPVRRRRDCPACGQDEVATVVSESLHDFVSPITGIISNVQITDSAAAGVFHASAAFVHPACATEQRPPLTSLRSLGKGRSAQEAETRAVAEAIERYSSVYQGTEWRVRKRLDEVQDEALLPNDILLFSDSQFQRRAEWNSSHSEQQWVPEPIQPASDLTFTRAKSAVSGELKLIPSGLCFMHFTFSNEPRFCSPDTNGCGAGRTFPDALLAATLELVERDAVALWWYNRLLRPSVDLDSIGDLTISEIHAAFRHEGRDLRLLDVTSDLGIPSYVAVAPARDGLQPYFGCAAHTSPRIAALKAILEAAQVWFWSERGLATADLSVWLAGTNVKDHDYLVGKGVARAPRETFLKTDEALQLCIDRIGKAGIELFYVDLTRPEVGVPVVRAIAPGLRHFWARFAGGRLYDVPVRMGWLERETAEAELNPVPCMI
jgi:ribosomal protein S12 methylthiotransferase accessory factor